MPCINLTKGNAMALIDVNNFYSETECIEAYFQTLKIGAVFDYDLFVYNDVYPISTIVKFVKIKNNASILLMCRRESHNPWSIIEIKSEKGILAPTGLGSYFDKDDADKAYCTKQELENIQDCIKETINESTL
jgi:hypothetical protein